MYVCNVCFFKLCSYLGDIVDWIERYKNAKAAKCKNYNIPNSLQLQGRKERVKTNSPLCINFLSFSLCQQHSSKLWPIVFIALQCDAVGKPHLYLSSFNLVMQFVCCPVHWIKDTISFNRTVEYTVTEKKKIIYNNEDFHFDKLYGTLLLFYKLLKYGRGWLFDLITLSLWQFSQVDMAWKDELISHLNCILFHQSHLPDMPLAKEGWQMQNGIASQDIPQQFTFCTF